MRNILDPYYINYITHIMPMMLLYASTPGLNALIIKETSKSKTDIQKNFKN